MAGKNIILKPGQILFKEGDPSDGMYLVRKGELCVYLDQGTKEVKLATVTEGGMIGEMALFDQKPRSASVKATKEAEVTLISNDDFAKLMKQIPKWFTSLMGTLSGRLRTTNERLQKLEGGTKPKVFEITLRVLQVLTLLLQKNNATKDSKSWQADKAESLKIIKDMFPDHDAAIEQLLVLLVNCGFLATSKGELGNVVLATNNKAQLTGFCEFLRERMGKNPAQPYLSDPALHLLQTLGSAAEKSAYDTFTASLGDLMAEGRKARHATVETWKDHISQLSGLSEEVQIVKTSDGSVGLRTTKKGIKRVIVFCEVGNAMHHASLP